MSCSHTFVIAVSDGSHVNSKSWTNSWMQLEIMLSHTITQNNYYTICEPHLWCISQKRQHVLAVIKAKAIYTNIYIFTSHCSLHKQHLYYCVIIIIVHYYYILIKALISKHHLLNSHETIITLSAFMLFAGWRLGHPTTKTCSTNS